MVTSLSRLVAERLLGFVTIGQREGLWVETLLYSRTHTLLAVENQAILGFLGHAASRDKDADKTPAEVLVLCVGPKHWQKSIGRTLWRKYYIQLQSEWLLHCNSPGRDRK